MSRRRTDREDRVLHPVYNLLNYGDIDFDALDRDFVWLKAEFSDFKTLYEFIDRIDLDQRVRALKFEPFSDDSCCVYAMCDASAIDRDGFITLAKKSLDDPVMGNIAVDETSSRIIPKSKLFQLLLNSLGNNRWEDASNAQGRLFKVVKRIDSVKKFDEFTASYIAIEFIVRNAPDCLGCYSDLVLDFRATRFNNALREDVRWGKTGKEAVTRFRYIPGAGMQTVTTREDDGTTFVHKSCWSDEKTHLDMLDFSGTGSEDDPIGEDFRNGRAYELNTILKKLELVYGPYIGRVSLIKTEAAWASVESPRYYEKRRDIHFNGMPVYICNMTGDRSNDAIIQEFTETVRECYGFDLRFTNSPPLDGPRIPVILPEKTYRKDKSLTDPHRKKGYTVLQHVVINNLEGAVRDYRIESKKSRTRFENRRRKWVDENPGSSPEDYPKQPTRPTLPLAETLFEQIYIKQEIEQGRLEYFDWTAQGYAGDWEFAIPLTHTEKHKRIIDGYAQFVIHPDGTMKIPEDCIPSDPISGDFPRVAWPDAEYAVKDPAGRINIIRSTDVRTIPDVEMIRNILESNHEERRGRTEGLKVEAARSDLWGGCVDIGYEELDEGRWIYYVGSNNLNQSVANASVVRLAEGLDGSEVFLRDLLPMMSATFVKHKQLTVIPFPVKYLREWADQLGYFVESMDDDIEEPSMTSTHS